MTSDEWLARRVSRGSTRAFALLYGRHHQALYRYCRSIVHNEDDAQEALQNAMERALASLQARERDVAVRPWLFRIVHNEAVSLLRRRRPDVSLVEDLDPVDGGLEPTVEQRERFAGLIADLQLLAERQRAALVMRELSGLSIAEIAAALSSSPGAAKQAIFEARCALHEFEEGRAMECEAVRRAISDGDGRMLRARKIRAHLRACQGCRDFEVTISRRTAELRALAPPLPAAAATAMLARLLTHGASGGHSGVAAAASGAALGNHAAVSVTVKALAAVAVLGAATGGAVHIAASPAGHPIHSVTNRTTPLRSGTVGGRESAHAGPGAPATLQPGSGAKRHRAASAKGGKARGRATEAISGAGTTIGGRHGKSGGETAHGRGHLAGGSNAQAHRRSGTPQSRAGHAQRSPKSAQHTLPARRVKEGHAQTSAPAAERPPARGGLGRPIPGEEAQSQLAPTAGG